VTYLLDTHTLIWFLRVPSGLPPQVRTLIEDPESTLAISLATPWEMAIKVGVSRLDAQDILDDFDAILTRGNFNLVTPTVAQVIGSGRLPLYHRDPFDRLIAYQSIDLGWTVLSKDVILDAYGVRRLWN
jgi:PIN domain nuclease of toxin-antitoxin system